jgi:hypothetical protein
MQRIAKSYVYEKGKISYNLEWGKIVQKLTQAKSNIISSGNLI